MLSVLLYGCSTMKAFDEELYDFAEAVSDKDVVTGERSLNFTNRQSQISNSSKIEKDIIDEILKSGGKINQDLDPNAYERLNTVLSKVISVSHLKNESWTAYLIPYEGFNAFVVGGQSIFVHYDLIKQIKSDDELAVILGHEIAHVAANHIYEKEAQFITLKIAGSKSVSKEGYLPSYVINDEKEADMVGIMYATLAGYNPYAASQLWNRLSEKESNLTLYYLSHPKSTERASYNANYAKTIDEYYIKNTINPESDKVLKCNKLWCNKENSFSPGKGGGVFALLTVVANSLIAHGQAKYEKQQQEIEIAQSQQKLAESSGLQTVQTSNATQTAITHDDHIPETYTILTVINNTKIYSDLYIGKVQFYDNEEELNLKIQFSINENEELIGTYEFTVDEKTYFGKLKNAMINKNSSSFKVQFDFNDDFNNNGQIDINFDKDGTYFRGNFKKIYRDGIRKKRIKRDSGKINGKLIGE